MKKIAYILLTAFVLTWIFCIPSLAFDEFTVQKTNTPPVIDGKLDDCYVKLHDFYDTDQFPTDSDSNKEGKGATYITWDDNNLYVYIEAYHNNYEPVNNPKVAASGSCMYLAILAGLPEAFDEDSQIQLAINLSDEGKQEYKYTASVPEKDRYDSVEDISPTKLIDYITVRDESKKITYYEIALPWNQLDRTGTYKFVEGHKFTFNYIVVMDPPIIVQYGQGLMNDIYDGGGILTLGAAPAVIVEEVEEAAEPEAAVTLPAPAPVPQTGDNSAFMVIVLAIIFASAILVTTKKIKVK
ncbi:MAG: hypothetical protein FWF15_06550 [Oscillospiraceae bacterium]|nr:hypothetical protein [Oscillospiraceae bacterium]